MSEKKDWKREYLQHVKEVANQEARWDAMESGFRRAILHLAGAGHGAFPELDALLGKVRAETRSGGSTGQVGKLASEAWELAVRLRGNAIPEDMHDVGTVDAAETSSATRDHHRIPHRALLDLLEHAEIPEEMLPRATALRDRLAGNLSEDEIRDAVREFAAIIVNIREDVQREKQEIEAFLVSVSERIQRIDATLSQLLASNSEAARDGDNLRGTLETELSGMRGDIDTGSNLVDLKQTLQTSLDKVQHNMLDYLEREDNRHRESEEKIHQLCDRLNEMEQESCTLREQIELEREHAYHDPLTRLPNRLALDERLPQEFARWKRYGQPLCVALLDVDHFKKVNDTFGHQAGDRVLVELAQQVVANARESDFVCRYGGEEIIILMPGTTLEQGVTAANKIRDRIANLKFRYARKPVPVTLSAGVAEFSPGDNPEQVLSRADAALYAAKSGGRNRVLSEHDAGPRD